MTFKLYLLLGIVAAFGIYFTASFVKGAYSGIATHNLNVARVVNSHALDDTLTETLTVVVGDSTGAFNWMTPKMNAAVNLSVFNGTTVEAHSVLEKMNSKEMPNWKCLILAFGFVWDAYPETIYTSIARSGVMPISNFFNKLVMNRIDDSPFAGISSIGSLFLYGLARGQWFGVDWEDLRSSLPPGFTDRMTREYFLSHMGHYELPDPTQPHFAGHKEWARPKRIKLWPVHHRYLKEILKLALNRGLKVFASPPPASHSFSEEYNDEYNRDYRKIYESLDVIWLESPARAAMEFYIPRHLADEGAKLYTEQFIPRINQNCLR